MSEKFECTKTERAILDWIAQQRRTFAIETALARPAELARARELRIAAIQAEMAADAAWKVLGLSDDYRANEVVYDYVCGRIAELKP